jgi:hypothetical protein
MKVKVIALVPAVLAAAVLLLVAPASAAPGNIGFGFNATGISGFPTGAATLTGGGSYNPGTVSSIRLAAFDAPATSGRDRWPAASPAKASAGTRSNCGQARPSSALGQRRSP